jgi:hypothetical protein
MKNRWKVFRATSNNKLAEIYGESIMKRRTKKRESVSMIKCETAIRN